MLGKTNTDIVFGYKYFTIIDDHNSPIIPNSVSINK